MPISAQENERKLLELFSPGTRFTFDGIEYESKISAKPRSQDGSGEPITDLYLEAEAIKEKVDDLILKISLKKTSWEFIKNHMQKSDAKELFFDDYNSVIKNYIENSYDLLKDLPVVDLDWNGTKRNQKLDPGGFTLGWEMMITKKDRLESFGRLPSKYVNELVLGEHLQKNRRNAKVEEKVIAESGIPTHVLTQNLDENPTHEAAFQAMLPIEDFMQKYQNYFHVILKANNYRSLRNDKSSKGRCDGSRFLFIQNRWFVKKNGKGKRCLSRELICDFDKVFDRNDQCRESLEAALNQLGIDIRNVNLANITLCDGVPENHQ